MEVRVLVIEFDENPRKITMGEFFKEFNKNVVPFIPFENLLQYALTEMVRNIYHHANGKGRVEISRSRTTLWFSVTDFGPGYIGKSEAKTVSGIKNYHKKNGSTKPGLACNGIDIISNCLNAIKKDPETKAKDPGAWWKANINKKGRFEYSGYYTSAIYSRFPSTKQDLLL